MRLPGEAYEKLYNVKKDELGNYSAFDRYRILADIAPYSDQYRAAKKEVSLLNQNNLLEDNQLKEYKEIRKQTSSKLKKKNFYEEKFQNSEVDYETVTVSKVLDANTFLTEEYDQNPFKFAGITVKSDDEQTKSLVEQFVKPGQRLKVAIDKDPLNRVRKDSLDTMRVVVYTPRSEKGSMLGLNGIGSGSNLNLYLANQSEEKGGNSKTTIKDDKSGIATHALFSESQITTGKYWEKIVHDVLPSIPVVNILSDKFLQVKSPIESYERELYSKSWRDWKNPISGWMLPMLDSTARRNPLMSAANGLGIGLLGGMRSKYKWAIGLSTATVFGTMSGARTVLDFGKELTNQDTPWIPKRREKERDVDEYFDKVKYIKYHGLYQQAKEQALKYEGIDLDNYFEESEKFGKDNKNLKAYLNHKKKWLTIEKKATGGNEGLDEELKSLRESLKVIDDKRPNGEVGSYTALAMRYKDTFESTLYGASETRDYNQIYRALPNKDKQYFTAFQKASPRERKRILKLVPKNQKPIYQAQFGLKVDEKESLNSYFRKHNLPNENWEGWKPNVSMDNIKVKVMKQEGIELTEANYWSDDEKIAEESGVKPIDTNSYMFSSFINKGELEKVLRGAGLEDVRIQMTTSESDTPQIQTNISLQKDRTAEIEDGLKEYMTNL